MFSLLFALSAFAAEIGPAEILSQKCRKTGEQVTCQVETSTDPGGAKYKLFLTDEAGNMSPILSLLPLVQESRLCVYFSVKGLEAASDNLLEGRFEKVVVQPRKD